MTLSEITFTNNKAEINTDDISLIIIKIIDIYNLKLSNKDKLIYMDIMCDEYELIALLNIFTFPKKEKMIGDYTISCDGILTNIKTGTFITLTPNESKITFILLNNKDEILDLNTIYRSYSGSTNEPTYFNKRSIEVYLRKLRKSLINVGLEIEILGNDLYKLK